MCGLWFSFCLSFEFTLRLPRYSSCMSVFRRNLPKERLKKCSLHLTGFRECFFLSFSPLPLKKSLTLVIWFFVQIQDKEGKRHFHSLFVAFAATVSQTLSPGFLLQTKTDQTRRKWRRRAEAKNPRPIFYLGILCRSANRWLSLCRWQPTVQASLCVCVCVSWFIVLGQFKVYPLNSRTVLLR